MRKKLSLLSVIIKSKQKIQVIKLWKEPGNNWAIELGMTNPRPLEQSLTESKKVKSSKSFVWPNIIKPLSWCVSKKNSHFAVDVVQFVVEVDSFLLLSGAQHALVSHWAVSGPGWVSHWALHHCRSRWAVGPGAASATTPPSLLLLSD